LTGLSIDYMDDFLRGLVLLWLSEKVKFLHICAYSSAVLNQYCTVRSLPPLFVQREIPNIILPICHSPYRYGAPLHVA
jgi:hypothetical protein